MDSLFKKQNVGQFVLVILFIIYLIMGYKVPDTFAGLIDSTVGKIVVVIMAISLFAYANPVLGVLGLFVAYDLIRKSSITTGTAGLEAYMPTEEKKMSQFTAFNQFPYTLEQEVVTKMAPLHTMGVINGPATFKPILDDYHDASPI